jgi:ATP-binding cassette, subfamily B, multidrug efflux pump
MTPARRLLGYLFRYRGRYAAGAVCLVLATGVSLGIPWTVKNAIDALARGEAASLADYAGVILLLAAAHGVARLGSRLAMIGAGQRVEQDVRQDLYEHLERLPSAFYHRNRTGDLVSRASSDVATIRTLAGFGTVMLLSTSLVFAGTIGAMWLIDPWLTLAAMAPFPLVVMLARRFNHAVDLHSSAVQEQLGALSAKVQENLTGSQVVRAYTMENAEVARFTALNREYLARSVLLARTQAGFTPLIGLVSGVGTLIILWLGGRAVVEGRITLGAFVAFNGYLAHLAWPTIALGWTVASVRRGLTAMVRIAAVLDEPVPDDSPAEGPTGACIPSAGRTSIEARDLTFAYEGRAPALRDVSFRVPAGTLTAVVGPTGSGKSTLGVLLVRLFEPPRHTLWLGSIDVRDIPRPILRRLVVYVPQEPFLFSRSLRDNLMVADESASPEAVTRAVETAGLSEEVAALPDGLDTEIGERGITLSGGQRARVALARALLLDPAVLVLDDPFAAVDPHKETEVLRGLRAARAGRTTLIMTHRLRAAAEADQVLVLDEGRVVEEGTHAALVSAEGLYTRLWRIQQLEEELERSEP